MGTRRACRTAICPICDYAAKWLEARFSLLMGGGIPAHLAELSPNSVRAFLPGFAYQSAGVLASSVVYIEAVYAQKTSYATAMALTAMSVFVLASIMAAVGRERRGHHFGS